MNNFHMREGKVEFRWKRWRNKKRQEVSSCLMVLFSGAVLLGAGGVALAGPTGGQVTGGQGQITNPNGTTTNINQQSNVLTINWQDFSIQQGETVNFYQPGSTSIAINRVVGGVPSYLAGALNANGRVFILNSAGITFTGTSQVNVGALLATTAMTVNGDPTQAASYSGSGYGAVVNQGSISVSNGGFAILAAPYVQNTGFIKADLGTIALAGTNQFTLDLSGTGLINFVVPAGAVEKIVSDGKAVGVDNSGTLQARSGQVVISANVASEVVNAVVNLNGIVDADAFAANGKGGAVLVSAAGDINVGGQVTAKGSGSGAGGQIVTKAVGADNIEQMAFVSARGGSNGGLGGQIEVSGKTVGLNGSVDPGKGGLLYIDPLQFTIRNGTNGQSASGIGERRLEGLLQNGVDFSVNAQGNITIQDLSDNVLAGGGGDLTLHAGTGGAGNIIVQGINDIIRTGSGNVTLTAAGNIGDPSHELSFVSGGANLTGVSQAGDIVLTATNGGNIYINSVTERAAGPGTRHAVFSANAAGVFSADGLIDVEARANGVGTQSADAEIHINANEISLHGVTALANATKHASSGSNAGGIAVANAIVSLNATQASDRGAMTVAAAVAGSSGFSFHANANLFINEQTGFFMKGGPISVTARANVFSAGTASVESAVRAEAGLRINGSGEISIDSAGVHATAVGDKVGNDVASAHAQFNGNDIRIFGNASVTANGQAGPNGAALVVADATMNATGTAVDLSSNVTVTAEANNPDHGRGASATADLRLIAVSNTVNVGGDITVNADALNSGSSFARAEASLVVNGQKGIDINGNVTVLANGLTPSNAGTDKFTPRASASASFSANDGNIRIGGGLDVEANISSNNVDGVIALARAHLNASGTGAGSITIEGATKVLASARANAHTGFFSGASANASLSIHAEGHVALGDVTVKATADSLGEFKACAVAVANIVSASNSVQISGDVDVEANAQDAFGNGALANAQFVAQAASGVFVGSPGSDSPPRIANLTVSATADNGGAGNASAIAHASMEAQNPKFAPVGVFGNVAVIANAHDTGGGNAFASAAATFLGGASFSGAAVRIGAFGTHDSVVGGHLDVEAHAIDNGGNQAIAVADVKMSANTASNVDSGRVEVLNGINVVANAQHSGGADQADAGASANAQLFFNATSVQVDGATQVNALASNNGAGKVKSQGAITFSKFVHSVSLGDVTIDVAALNLGEGNGGATASANFIASNASVHVSLNSLNLQAQASTNGGGNAIANAIGRITQSSLEIPGNVTVNALAFRSGGGVGNAVALASLELRGSSLDPSVGGDVKVTANAVDSGAGNAEANAHALFAGSDITLNNVLVGANAFARDGAAAGTAANANAQLYFEDATTVTVAGQMSIVAHGTNDGAGKVKASAGLNFSSVGAVTLNAVLFDVKALNLGNGTGGAKANAVFETSASTINLSVNSLNMQAQASSHGGGNADALASVNIFGEGVGISGDITVNALANTEGAGNATACANLTLDASSGSVTVGGNIDAHANAQAGGAGQAQANAIVTLLAFSSEGSSGGHVGIGNINVIANALHSGSGAGALALAELIINPVPDPQSVTIGGDVNVEASANNVNGFAGNMAASANALISVGDISTLTIDGAVTILANATNTGKGKVFAQGSLDLFSIDTVTLNAVTIDVAALNIGTGTQAGTGGAQAKAIFRGSEGSSNMTVQSVNLQAQASSLGHGNAVATASAQLNQDVIALTSVTINALAVARGGNASAVANLHLAASGSESGVGINVTGAIDVHANAQTSGAGNAQASAIAAFLASSGDDRSKIEVQGVNVTANAQHSGAAGGGAFALAELTATGDGATFAGSVNVTASANNLSGRTGPGKGASANALFSITASSNIEVDNNLSVLAHATNNGKGKVNAIGSINLGSSVGQVTLGNVTIDVAALNINSQGTGGAVANAIFLAGNETTVNIGGDVNLQAHATSAGAGNAAALASGSLGGDDLVFSGNLTINAVAHAHQGSANAHAVGLMSSAGSTISVDNVFVTANAIVDNNGKANANADLTIDPVRFHASGSVVVTAAAVTNSGNASAGALLDFEDTKAIEIDGLMSVAALATNHGAGRVTAKGTINFASATNLSFSDVVIDVAALNLGSGTGGANAVAKFVPASGAAVSVSNSLNVTAHAESHGTGNAIATASAQLLADQIDIAGNVIVNAVAISDPGHASALANLGLLARVNGIAIGGNVDVHALASEASGNANAQAVASLGANQGGNGIRIGSSNNASAGHFFVRAYANGHGTDEGSFAAQANAHVFMKAPFIAIDNSMSIVAHATNDGFGKVKGQGSLVIADNPIVDLDQVTIDVKALNVNTNGSGGAVASANFSLGLTHLNINGLNLQAQASSHGGGNATANAIGVINQADLSISGNVIVNAFAFTDGSNGRAKALAQFDASAGGSDGNLTIGGNVDVTAVAKASDPLSAIATADVALFAEGAVHVVDNVVVAATASTNATNEGVTGEVLANARLNVHGCEGAFFGTTAEINGQTLFFDGDVSVTANEFSHRAQRGAAVAIASIEAGPGVASGGSIGIAGNVLVRADAGGGSTGDANVIAYASLTAQASNGIEFARGVTVVANAEDNGTGAAAADAFANLSDSGGGSINVAGKIVVNAQLQGNGLEFGPSNVASLGVNVWAGYATASLTVDAGESAGDVRLGGVSVAANALLTNNGEGRGIGNQAPWGGAFAEANIVSSSGSVFINGPVQVGALGVVSGTNMLVGGTAELTIQASGDVRIAGPVRARGNAQALGTDDTANGTVLVNIEGSDITLSGVAAAAIATASGDSALAKAKTGVQLNASHDLNITHSGAFAGAFANAPFASSGEHVVANANLQLVAGHNLTDNGSIIAAAVGLGGGTGDVADAIVNIQADPSSQGFGNVQVHGDIGAFAFADPVNDHALASVTIHAHNNIFIIGDDPIASAGAGSARAFLQEHFTNSITGFGGSGSSATAKITITAGGNIIFIGPDFDNVLALLALPTQTPTIQPGDLTTIEMFIDGQDCGVLGSAGMDPNKPAACGKVAINIPPGDDALP